MENEYDHIRKEFAKLLVEIWKCKDEECEGNLKKHEKNRRKGSISLEKGSPEHPEKGEYFKPWGGYLGSDYGKGQKILIIGGAPSAFDIKYIEEDMKMFEIFKKFVEEWEKTVTNP